MGNSFFQSIRALFRLKPAQKLNRDYLISLLCAVLLRASGVHSDDVMSDYLAANDVNAARIAQEAERLLFTTFGENCKYLYDVIYYILNRNK